MVINTVTKLMFTSLSCYVLLCTKKVILKESKMSAKSPLTNKQNTELCQAARCRGCAAWQGSPWYFRALLYLFFPRTLPHLACGRLSHEKSVHRAASKLVLARTAQQTAHLQKTPTVMAARFPPGIWEEAHFFPVSLAAA